MSSELVTLSIDGTEVTVPKGTLLIRAAEQLGIEIPRFCDHPMLDPVGACRQCYVEVEGQAKLFTSCTTTVTPGMVVKTQNASEKAHEAQVANLEFLLLNHPLDCPICDRGGECPLQDQALAFGPGESRYREAKRVFAKPVPLSPLVNLDRERCVLCARCTRFCDQISGDRFIELYARGASQQVAIAAGEDFRSPFSGNTVQICPVGALTATPYRFVARPFDLSSADSVCPHCSAGCNLKVDMRRGEVVRQLARDNVEVNDAWICDKGRFAFRFPDAPDRITTPLIRDRGLEPASFGEVFGRISKWTRGKRVAFLAGGRLTDEDAYALAKLARTVFGTNDLDHRRHMAGGELEVLWAAGLTQVTYQRVERAKAIVVVGLDAEQEVPILHLRLRKAARRGAKIVVVHPRRTRLHDVAGHILCRPGAEASVLEEIRNGSADTPAGRVGAALREAGSDGVVLVGSRLLDVPGAADGALDAATATGARISLVARRANDLGTLRSGVHPSLLPGGRPITVDEDRAEVEAVWGPIRNMEPGLDSRGIVEACSRREVDVLFLVGVDPLRDFPDADLARRALENVPVKVVQSLELGSLGPYVDAFLPAAAFIEKDGHFTTWEGRGQRLRPLRPPPGIALPDWEIFASLALACGGDLGFETLEELQDELGGLIEPRESVSDIARSPAPSSLADGLTLFTYPLLVDGGRLSDGAGELKAALQDEAFAEVNPHDAAAAGIRDGGRAIVRTSAGEAELPVRVTEHVARGAVFVPFNQPGLAANTLLSGTFSTTTFLEAVAAPADVGDHGGPGAPQHAEVGAGGEV